MKQGTTNSFIKRNKLQTQHAEIRARNHQQGGKGRIARLTQKDLEVIGAVMYWAEGYKRLKIKDGRVRMDHKISFVNADPEMIRVFIRFLRECMHIAEEEIRLSMRLYMHINEKEARSHWMRVTGLPEKRFYKTTYLVSSASKGIRPYNRLPQGTLQVEVCSTSKFHHLLGLIEGVKGQL